MKLEEAKLNFDQGLEESESLFLYVHTWTPLQQMKVCMLFSMLLEGFISILMLLCSTQSFQTLGICNKFIIREFVVIHLQFYREIKKLHSRLLSTAEALHDYVDELQLEKRDKLASIAASARSRLSAIARTKGPKVAASVLDDIEASTNLQSLKWEERSSSATKTSQPPGLYSTFFCELQFVSLCMFMVFLLQKDGNGCSCMHTRFLAGSCHLGGQSS